MTAPSSHDASVARFERSFLALAAGDALARATGFAATVYLARTLGADPFGVVALAAAIALYPAGIADFGIAIVGGREVASDVARARRLAPALITARFLVACAAAAAMAGLSHALLRPPESVVLSAYALTLLPVGLNATWILVGLEDARPAGVARVAGSLLVLAATVVLVRGAADLVRAPLAVLAGELLTVAVVLVAVGRRGFRIRPCWDPSAVGPVFRSALPLVGYSLLTLAIYNADLVFVRLFHDRAAVGNYAVAYALVTLLVNAGVIYGQSLVPALTRLRSEGGDGALLQTSYARMLALALPAAVGGGMLAPLIITTFFGAEYQAAPLALAVLLCSVPVAVIRCAATSAIVAGGGGAALFRITIRAALVTAVLDLALIPGFGILGAALASVATEAALAWWALRCARDLGYPDPELRRFGVAAVGCAFMAVALAALAEAPLFVSVPAGALVYGATLVACGALRVRRGGLPTLRV